MESSGMKFQRIKIGKMRKRGWSGGGGGQGRVGRCGVLDIDLIGSLTVAVFTASLSTSHYLQ